MEETGDGLTNTKLPTPRRTGGFEPGLIPCLRCSPRAYLQRSLQKVLLSSSETAGPGA
jgi:hypothetical protein